MGRRTLPKVRDGSGLLRGGPIIVGGTLGEVRDESWDPRGGPGLVGRH